MNLVHSTCPIFRSHGHRPHNEMWTYDKVEPVPC